MTSVAATDDAIIMEFRGEDRKGASVMGRVPIGVALPDFVRRKHRAGWRWLEVDVNLHDGRAPYRAGGIEPHPDRRTGRIWWADNIITPIFGDDGECGCGVSAWNLRIDAVLTKEPTDG